MGKERHAILEEGMLCAIERHPEGLAGRGVEEGQDDGVQEIAR